MYPGTPVQVGPASGELVWRWYDDSCSFGNIPDAPVRAFRDAEGMVNLTIPHYDNYKLKGVDFNTLQRDCSPIYTSPMESNPAEHRGAHWIQSLYTEDGTNFHAIIHNENFDAIGYGVGNYYSTSACYAYSVDGASSFTLPEDHVIFSPSNNTTGRPFAPIGHEGFQPFSNIIKKDGYYYFYGYITLENAPSNGSPLYLFRSGNLADPHAWRGYDGTDFTVELGNAYTEALDLSSLKRVGEDSPWDGATAQLGTNITWNTYFEKYMMVGISSKSGVYGIYYSLSEDLIKWSVRVPLKLFSSAYQMGLDIVPNPSKITVTYASVIDHDDTSLNFEQSDSTIYLYWVENDPSSFGTDYFAYSRSIRRQALTLTKNVVSEFIVTSRLDIDDYNNGDGLARGQNGANFVQTLRAALTESSSRPPYAINDTLRIRFNIPGTNHTIQLGSDLPSTFRIGIDASTEPGSVLNSSFLPNGMNVAPKIVIQGGLLPLRADYSYIKNIEADQVYMYGNHQSITHSLVQDLVIEGVSSTAGGENNSNRIGKIALTGDSINASYNFIGLDHTGTSSIAEDNDPLVRMFGSNNILANNLIGGALNQAVQIEPDVPNGRLASGNVIENNLIGVGPDQLTQGYIQNDAIEIKNGASGNTIRNNYISGAEHGIYIADANSNLLIGNIIGSAETSLFQGNRSSGVWITGTSQGNSIGSGNWAERNTIRGNGQEGINFLNLQGQNNPAMANIIWQNPAAALNNPSPYQPARLQALSVYLNEAEDTLYVNCSADTFSNTGLYVVEAYQTNTESGFSEAERLISSYELSASQLASFQIPINVLSYDNSFSKMSFLLTDPLGNTSMLSEAVSVLSATFSPQPSISIQQFETGIFVETIQTELSNNGNANLIWSASGSDWAIVEPNNGVIEPGQSAMIGITLYRGDYCEELTDTLYLINNSFNNSSIPLYVHMDAYPQASIDYTGSLSICPGGSILLRGPQGNDFTFEWFKNGVNTFNTNQNYLAQDEGSYSVVVHAGSCTDTSEAVSVSFGGNLTATISFNGNTSLCGGSPVQLSANTGAGYVYQWLLNNANIPGANQSTYSANNPGNYAVRITSGGCTLTSSPVNITGGTPPPAMISMNGNGNICQGQTLMLNGNPGMGLGYQWLRNGQEIPGANTQSYPSTTSGLYTLRTTLNGCSGLSQPVNVTVNPAPVAEISSSGLGQICEGNAAELNATPGAGYTFQWYRNGNMLVSATNSSYTTGEAGMYTLEVSASGCTSQSDDFEVLVNPAPVAEISSSSSGQICEGNAAELNATPGAGYTYQWYRNGNMLVSATNSSYTTGEAGMYTLEVSALGCTSQSESFEITVNALLEAPLIEHAGNVIVSGFTGYHVWFINGEEVTDFHTDSIEVSSDGIYSCMIGIPGCLSEISNEVIILPLSTGRAFSEELYLHPNPSGGQIKLSSGTWEHIEIYNSMGQLVFSQSRPAAEVNLSILCTGIYTARYFTDCWNSERFFLNK